MKNAVRRTGLTVALVGAMLVPLSAAPANAFPGSCYLEKAATIPRVYGGCWDGSGTFSIWAQCKEPWGYVFRQSPWTRVQFLSTADVWCAGSVYLYGMYKRG